MVSKMNDIEKTLKFIIHENLEYWKEILTYPRKSRENIEDE